MVKFTYQLKDYNDWDRNIFEASVGFEAEVGHYPNILLANPETLNALDLYMSKKLLSEGRVSEIKSLDKFTCSKFTLQICLDYEIPNHQFAVVYDPDAFFEGEE